MKEENEEKNLEIAEVITKSEQFIEKNKKMIIIVVGAVLVAVLAIFGMNKWYFQPRQIQAAEEMFAAENWFAESNYELALNGNDQFPGFLDIADQYGCTKAGNLAKYYAGACQLRLGQYDEAIKNLKSYNGKDIFTAAEALMMIGDCYAEKEDYSNAARAYMKAANENDNFVTAPTAWWKAGYAYLKIDNKEEAKKCFTNVKELYPQSTEYSDIDKYIGLAE